jgi:cell division septation protein DedD
LAAAGAAGAWAQGRDEGVPVVRAEPGPIKVRPADPGGYKPPHTDRSIYDRISPPRAETQGPAAGGRKKQVAEAPAYVGPYRVQLGSYREPEMARKRWTELKKSHGDLLARFTMVIEKVNIPGKGAHYRLQAGPLASPKDVDGLCRALAKRQVHCILVKA